MLSRSTQGQYSESYVDYVIKRVKNTDARKIKNEPGSSEQPSSDSLSMPPPPRPSGSANEKLVIEVHRCDPYPESKTAIFLRYIIDDKDFDYEDCALDKTIWERFLRQVRQEMNFDSETKYLYDLDEHPTFRISGFKQLEIAIYRAVFDGRAVRFYISDPFSK